MRPRCVSLCETGSERARLVGRSTPKKHETLIAPEPGPKCELPELCCNAILQACRRLGSKSRELEAKARGRRSTCLNPANVNKVLHNARPPTESIIRAPGLRIVVVSD